MTWTKYDIYNNNENYNNINRERHSRAHAQKGCIPPILSPKLIERILSIIYLLPRSLSFPFTFSTI